MIRTALARGGLSCWREFGGFWRRLCPFLVCCPLVVVGFGVSEAFLAVQAAGPVALALPVAAFGPNRATLPRMVIACPAVVPSGSDVRSTIATCLHIQPIGASEHSSDRSLLLLPGVPKSVQGGGRPAETTSWEWRSSFDRPEAGLHQGRSSASFALSERISASRLLPLFMNGCKRARAAQSSLHLARQ